MPVISFETVIRPALIRRSSECECGWTETIEYEGGVLVAAAQCPKCSVDDLAARLVQAIRRKGDVREGFTRVLGYVERVAR